MSSPSEATTSTAGLVPVTPGNQNAPLEPFDFTPPGENTLNERIGLITNSVGVVLMKYEDEKEELKAEKKQLSDRVDARDDKIEDLEATIKSKTEEVTKKNAALAQKEKHNKRDKDIHKQIQDKMNKDISEHKQEIALAEAETQKKMNELDDAEKKITKLKQEATVYKMDTETQLITKQEDIDQLKGEMVELHDAHTIECAEKDSTIETVRAENMNLTSENKKLQDALVSKEDIHITTLASKDKELETTKAMVEQLRIQLENLGKVKQEIITESKKQKKESKEAQEANLRRDKKGMCENSLPIAIANTQIVDSDSDDDDKCDDDEDDNDDNYEDVVDDDDNNVTRKNVGMNPTNTTLNKKCDACGEELCTGDIRDCGTDIVFRRKCLGCDSTFGSKGAYNLHVKGDRKQRRGCVRWGRKFPVHIESYKKAYNEETDKYHPTFILNDRTKPASRNEQKAYVKHIETVLTEDKF